MTTGGDFDRRMMDVALRMARRGLGNTAPNPAVGAIVVDETTGEIIARGWTQPGGRPHAEKEALRRAGARARGLTMYLTLEPCAHTGRNPTCADAMTSSGLKRVVCAIPDPNPIISGRGFEQLADAGVVVEVGVGAEDARWITLGHILCQTEKRPFVQIKMALDANHRIALGDGAPVWVTSPEARAYAHLLRAEADAILVGAG
jgi:diaminohydroxyphosphoribosylaminopyrimidine deaminase / 5-amino-6-(5-phosphoribosylamino)uracil reductase